MGSASYWQSRLQNNHLGDFSEGHIDVVICSQIGQSRRDCFVSNSPALGWNSATHGGPEQNLSHQILFGDAKGNLSEAQGLCGTFMIFTNIVGEHSQHLNWNYRTFSFCICINYGNIDCSCCITVTAGRQETWNHYWAGKKLFSSTLQCNQLMSTLKKSLFLLCVLYCIIPLCLVLHSIFCLSMDRCCDVKGESRCTNGTMIQVCKCNFWLDPNLCG